MNLKKSMGLVGLVVSLVLAAPTPEWRADLGGVAFPAQPATGRIRGQAFSLEKAEFTSGNLKLRQGKDFFADREVTIFLFGADGKNPAGRTIEVPPSRALAHLTCTFPAKKPPMGCPKRTCLWLPAKIVT